MVEETQLHLANSRHKLRAAAPLGAGLQQVQAGTLVVRNSLTGLPAGVEAWVGLRAPRVVGRQEVAGQSRELVLPGWCTPNAQGGDWQLTLRFVLAREPVGQGPAASVLAWWPDGGAPSPVARLEPRRDASSAALTMTVRRLPAPDAAAAGPALEVATLEHLYSLVLRQDAEAGYCLPITAAGRWAEWAATARSARAAAQQAQRSDLLGEPSPPREQLLGRTRIDRLGGTGQASLPRRHPLGVAG